MTQHPLPDPNYPCPFLPGDIVDVEMTWTVEGTKGTMRQQGMVTAISSDEILTMVVPQEDNMDMTIIAPWTRFRRVNVLQALSKTAPGSPQTAEQPSQVPVNTPTPFQALVDALEGALTVQELHHIHMTLDRTMFPVGSLWSRAVETAGLWAGNNEALNEAINRRD